VKISPSGSVSKTAKSAKSPESYAFYVAVTDAIMALMGRVRRECPAQTRFRGMDLSHAFEAMLYFSSIHNPGLVGLHANPRDRHAAKLLGGSSARLLAMNGFAQGAAFRAVAKRDRIGKIYHAMKRIVFRSAALPSVAQEGPATEAPILFFVRSARFARYFCPIADGLKGRCAFMIPGEDEALRALLSEWSIPVLRYHVATRPHGTMGALLAHCSPYLAAIAEGIELPLAQSQARLVVVPEGNSPEDEIVNCVAHKRGLRTACLQQGWSPIVHPGFCNLSYDEFLVWGDGFAELLAPYNPGQRFRAVGNHQLRFHAREGRSGVLFFFQGFENWLGGRESAEAMLELAERVADADPATPVFLRPHPVVPFPDDVLARLSQRSNIHVEPSSQVALADAFTKARVSVSTYSTTILESIAAGTVPIIFNTTSMPRYWPDVDAAGAGLEIRDIDEAESAVRRLLMDQAFFDSFAAPMATFAARFFQATGDTALAAIGTALSRLSEGRLSGP
jgi:hypothetical protein